MSDAAAALVKGIGELAGALDRPVSIMEVCGTHTVSLRRHGIHSLLPASIRLVSGPGCPVCVTPTGYIDNAIRLVEDHGAVVATFGDMVRVPGSTGNTLSHYLGTDRVRVVYSPAELQALAVEAEPRPVVFLGVGFETTIPTIATVFERVAASGPRNLYVYGSFKTVPRALQALIEDPGLRIDGFLLPGHVSAVIGVRAYDFLSETKRVPGVIAGFEALEMLRGIHGILAMVRAGGGGVRNAYTRVVRDEGNPRAQAVMDRLLEPTTELWRGMGALPGASLGLRPEFAAVDAARVFRLAPLHDTDPPGCRCADVVRGAALPPECRMFGTTCTPDRPIGPCMVSSEGTCAAHFRFRGERV